MPSFFQPDSFSEFPLHHAVALSDHRLLSFLILRLPPSPSPTRPSSESESLRAESLAEAVSAVLDRRDGVPNRLTPLHLAVVIGDSVAVRMLTAAGADPTLQDDRGWNAIQEAVCRRNGVISGILVRHQKAAAWNKWQRRLPRLVAELRRMRNFYMEVSFRFESSVVPFLGRVAPSDTYRIWKRDSELRVDMTIAGFDSLKTHRSDQSILFLGEERTVSNTDSRPNCVRNSSGTDSVPTGSVVLLIHEKKELVDVLEGAGSEATREEEEVMQSQKTVFRPGMDVTQAELVTRTNWRGQEKTETVAGWRAKVCDVNNVSFSFKTRRVAEDPAASVSEETDRFVDDSILELDEDGDGFLVAEIAPNPSRRRNSSFVQRDRSLIHDRSSSSNRKSVDLPSSDRSPRVLPKKTSDDKSKESEYKKSLKPCIWLAEDFPLKTEELLPLLDILANKVKAIRRLKELLTTKLPPGTFPIKVSIPVLPAVRVVITFTKFDDLPPLEKFYTPLSSPTHWEGLEDDDQTKQGSSSPQRNPGKHVGRSAVLPSVVVGHESSVKSFQEDLFDIPREYRWTTFSEMKKQKSREKKSKSLKKVK